MSSIIAINPFEVPAGMEDQALKLWDRLSAYFSKQPGYIGAKLHRSIDPSAKFHLVTVAEWASAEDFMRALSGEGLKTAASGLEAFPHYPDLYQVVRT